MAPIPDIVSMALLEKYIGNIRTYWKMTCLQIILLTFYKNTDRILFFIYLSLISCSNFFYQCVWIISGVRKRENEILPKRRNSSVKEKKRQNSSFKQKLGEQMMFLLQRRKAKDYIDIRACALVAIKIYRACYQISHCNCYVMTNCSVEHK